LGVAVLVFVVAAPASGLIGLDRQVLNKPARIRTHMLVVAGLPSFLQPRS